LNVADTELIVLLEQRDGPLPDRSWSHASEGECRYAELYDGQACPWCAAARRREQREAASTPSS
jgi:hypothetical protein